MILVIDGFNLIYKFSELENYMLNQELEKAMMELLKYLNELSYKLKKKPKIYVFFDGKKRKGDDTFQEEIYGIQCYYSHECSADVLIEEFIKNKRMNNTQGIKVISSDRRIQTFTKKYKYEIQSSEEFYKWFKEITKETSISDEKPSSLSNREVQYWLEVFKKR